MSNFLQILSCPVENGHKFQITGTTKEEAKIISILFSTGVTTNAGRVLKIDLDFDTNKIILNGSSENEVQLEIGGKFKFLVDIEGTYFNINFNDKHICKYETKKSADKIKSIIISGDLQHLLKVNHLSKEYPKIVENDTNLALESFIPIKYQPGHVIVISGECSEEFYVDFPENGKNRVLIHFNVRFREKSVIMDTMDQEVNSWTTNVDRPKHFPFEINKPFKIAFAFADELFKVAVNGNKLMDFSLFRILLNDDQTIWDILSGFRISNRKNDTITHVEHIKMDSDYEQFKQYSSIN